MEDALLVSASAKTRTKKDKFWIGLWIGIHPAISVSDVAPVGRADLGTMLSNGLQAPL